MVLNWIYFIMILIHHIDMILILVIYSSAMFNSVLFISGAAKRDKYILMTWMFFNVFAIMGYAYESIYEGIYHLGVIPVAIWAELVAYGAVKEAWKYDLDSSNLHNSDQVQPSGLTFGSEVLPDPLPQTGALPYPLTQTGAPPLPLTQSGAPSYPQTQVQTSAPEIPPYPLDPELPTYAQIQFGAPSLPSLQQDTSRNQSNLTLNSYT